jgi:hypothetical protein
VAYLGIVGVLGVIERLAGGTLWPVFPIQSNWHLMFWMLLGLSPLLGLQLGWSYELTDDALIVRRFGRERHRLALSTFERRSVQMGTVRLHFVSADVRLWSNADTARQRFLDEIDARAIASGARIVETLGARVEGERLTVRTDRLRFPSGCACCTREATTVAKLRAERGLDLVAVVHMQVLDVPVPVCALHAAALRSARIRAYGLVFVVTFLVTMALFFANSAEPSLGLAAFIGGLVGLLGMRIAEACKLSRFASYSGIGIAAVGLEADLTKVTLRIRDGSLRRALASDGSAEDVARVFA